MSCPQCVVVQYRASLTSVSRENGVSSGLVRMWVSADGFGSEACESVAVQCQLTSLARENEVSSGLVRMWVSAFCPVRMWVSTFCPFCPIWLPNVWVSNVGHENVGVNYLTLARWLAKVWLSSICCSKVWLSSICCSLGSLTPKSVGVQCRAFVGLRLARVLIACSLRTGCGDGPRAIVAPIPPVVARSVSPGSLSLDYRGCLVRP